MPSRTDLRAFLVLTFALILWVPAFPAKADEKPSPAQIEFFEKEIRPLLAERCYECHTKRAEGGLRLDSREAIRRGGESGPAVVPHKAEQSLLLEAVRYESFEMPPDGKLSDTQIAALEKWIKMGAPDPRDGAPITPVQESIDYEAGRQLWSLQPPERKPAPEVSRPEWIARPIDAFILARLDDEGIQPNPPAERRTLLRRVSFDLIGLPPSAESVEAFLADDSPDAYERAVEEFLSSPRLGEKWARMWLDLARYAEDQAHIVGNNKSLFYPNAYLYRDWVIGALNRDVPFDRFIKLQLAADLLEPEQTENLAALGFVGLGPKYYRRGALEVMADEWEDRVDVVTRGLLGLTVACARCHDHKYDPISTRDYYALAGVFASTKMFNKPLDEGRETDKSGMAKKPEDAMHVIREGKVQDLNVFIRGNVEAKGPVVPRRFLRVLLPGEPEPFTNGSGRLELAEAIVDPRNPLTARVFVNRVWGEMFGRPLVTTPSNFGNLGETPSHPELLDDLAVRFVESGWSLKWLLREIVLSSTYRQSSADDPQKAVHDAANRLLWKTNRRRLSVEAWRDALLAASGVLSPEIGGPSIDPQDPANHRRTIYSKVSRLDLNPMLATFDFPDPNVHAERRVETTTPLQKLFVMNSEFMVARAGELAALMRAKADETTVPAAIDWTYRRLYARPATKAEIDLGTAYLADAGAAENRWTHYAQVLLAANEMSFVD